MSMSSPARHLVKTTLSAASASSTNNSSLPMDSPITQVTRTSPRLRRTHHPPVAPESSVVSTRPEGSRGEDDGDYIDSEFSYVVNFGGFDPFIFIRSLPKMLPNIRCKIPKPKPANKKVTLVLDLDETLVHCSIDPMPRAEFNFKVHFNRNQYTVYVRRRPFLKEFLETVSQWFEVIVFTASQSVYADKLLDILDPEMTLFEHRLFRDACVCIDGNYLKDLRVLGRDLSQAAIIDNSPQAFGFHLDNGIPIESWFDDDSDQELRRMLPFLDRLRHVDDVRSLIRKTFKLHKLVEGPQPIL